RREVHCCLATADRNRCHLRGTSWPCRDKTTCRCAGKQGTDSPAKYRFHPMCRTCPYAGGSAFPRVTAPSPANRRRWRESIFHEYPSPLDREYIHERQSGRRRVCHRCTPEDDSRRRTWLSDPVSRRILSPDDGSLPSSALTP